MTWPPTPDLEARVLAHIDPRRPRRRRVAALAAAAVLIPAGGATAYRWLDLGSAEVRRTSPPSDVPAPPKREPVSLEQAERRAGFTPFLPPALGEPDAIYAARDLITLEYGDVRLAELPGALERELLQKFVRGDGDVRAVPGGAFIEGRHFYVYLRPDGSIREGTTATTTLLVERGDLLLRLEGDQLTLKAATLALAVTSTP